MSFFSIIIPTYNRAPLLQNLLQSFSSQTFEDFELLVIDDGGTDDSEKTVAAFSDPRFSYFKKPNGGVSSARNYGLTLARGRYINFFDSDDLAYPDHLMEAHRFFTANPGAGVVIFDYEWGNAEKQNYKRITNRYKDPNREILYRNYISTNCIFIKKDLTAALRFNENLSVSEDWDYWIRLSARARFTQVNTITSYIIEHGERSLKNINLASLITQKDHFVSSLKSDKKLMAVKNFNIKVIISHFDSFIALNAVLTGKKRLALRYFIKSSILYFPGLAARRSLAIIKHLLFTW